MNQLYVSMVLNLSIHGLSIHGLFDTFFECEAAQDLPKLPSGRAQPLPPRGGYPPKRLALPPAAPPRPKDVSTAQSTPPSNPLAASKINSSKGPSADFAEWKKRRGHPADARVFNIHGVFPGIRQALVERGWVENDDVTSPHWDFKYALMQRDLGDLDALHERQIVNFFGRSGEIAAKVGLCNNLYNCHFEVGVDVDCFLPRCYDLTNPAQVQSLEQDFKVTKCLCLLRRFIQDGGHSLESVGTAMGFFPRTAIAAALSVCRRRCQTVDDGLDNPCMHLVSDSEWQQVECWSLKHPGSQIKRKSKHRTHSQPPPCSSAQQACCACGVNPKWTVGL